MTEITNAQELYVNLDLILKDPDVTDIVYIYRKFGFRTANEPIMSDSIIYLLGITSDFMNKAIESIPSYYRYNVGYEMDTKLLFMVLDDSDVFRYEFGFGYTDVLSNLHWYDLSELRNKIDAIECPDKSALESIFRLVVDWFMELPEIRKKHIALISERLSSYGFKVTPSIDDYSSTIYLVT